MRVFSFRGIKPPSVYARSAREAGRIVELRNGPEMYPRSYLVTAS